MTRKTLETRPLRERRATASSALIHRLIEAENALLVADVRSAEALTTGRLLDLLRDARAALVRGPEGGGGFDAHDRVFRRVVEASAEMFTLHRPDGEVFFASPSAERVLGYSPAELVGRSPWDITHPDDLDALRERFAGFVRSGGHWRTSTFRARHRDGSWRWVEARATNLVDDPDIRGVALSLYDVTERVRSEEVRARSTELEMQYSRIQEASRLKSEYLANMSHELRTPLNAIIGFAELLHDGHVDPASPQHGEFLGDILASGRHLLELINDVLDLSKIEAGKLELRPARTSVRQLVAEVCSILRTAASKKSITVLTADDEVDEVFVDPSRLRQVLYNYLSNALKFTPPGGTVVVRTLAEGDDRFRVEVEDTGVGVAPADLGRLFVAFEQLDSGKGKSHQGTGLGLALTRRLVEAQGGSVGVRSVLGQGSVFHAVLPRDARHGARASSRVPKARQYRPSTVLVVDPDPRDRALLAGVLTRAGYSVEVASTGAAAIERCRDQHFDALTLELLLPDMSGLELLASIRVVGRNRAAALVLVTEVASDGVLSGAAVDDVLRKPLDPLALVGALERAGVRPDRPGGVLVIDDDPQSIDLVERALASLGHHVIRRTGSAAGLEAARRFAPVGVIFDPCSQDVNGVELLEALREVQGLANAPVLVLTGKDLTAAEHSALGRQAQALMSKRALRYGPGLVEDLKSFLREPRASLRQIA